MSFSELLLLTASIVLSSGRNLLSKLISRTHFGEKSFFLFQAVIFFTGAILLPVCGGITCAAPLTVLYAAIYGVLLILAQWCYTAAMRLGSTSLCATVYSLGFILPTLSGMIFWSEDAAAFKILGIILVIPAILLSGDKYKPGTGTRSRGYMPALTTAMLASGGLGIMQKVQGSSPYSEQRGAFVFIAFLLAGTLSLICTGFGKKSERITPRPIFGAAGAGICFAACNLLNTLLASRLDSAVFFPTLNIGSILLSLFLGILLYKEKFTRRQASVLVFAFSGIIFVNL